MSWAMWRQLLVPPVSFLGSAVREPRPNQLAHQPVLTNLLYVHLACLDGEDNWISSYMFPTLFLWIFILFLLQLSLTDLAIYGALRIYNIKSVRWSRIVRPIFLINFAESRQVRNGFNGNFCLWTVCCFLRTKGM